MALSTIPATDPSATGFGIPQNPDASAWRRCPTPGTGKSQFPPLLAFLKHPLRKYCEKNEPYAPQMLWTAPQKLDTQLSKVQFYG